MAEGKLYTHIFQVNYILYQGNYIYFQSNYIYLNLQGNYIYEQGNYILQQGNYSMNIREIIYTKFVGKLYMIFREII